MFLAISLFLLLAGILKLSSIFSMNYAYVLSTNWQICIPASCHPSELYSKDSGTDFHGDGWRYHIFTYEDPASIRTMLEWKSLGPSLTYYENTVSDWLNELHVPSGKRPDYAECLYWSKARDGDDQIVVLWDERQKLLYTAELFT